ncbi:MAG: hypothetical protein K2J16_03215, partial [Clostridia bacterium]|nr:hypothetical protein [Clostridia bacterium]
MFMSKGVRTVLIIFGVIVGAFCLILVSFFASTFAAVNKSVDVQHKRLESLRDSYQSGNFKAVDESDFCNFDISKALDKDIKLIDLQFLATHNSYKKEKTGLEKFYAKFSKGLREGNYHFESLTDQLNVGIRSFEYDLFYRRQKSGVSFHSFHIGYADMSSNAFDFSACLEELDLWSQNNPNHLPITVILELKENGGAYPYKTITKNQLSDLDELLKDKIKNLYTPSKAMKGYSDLNEMRANEDSPSLKETIGKVLFILHPSKLTKDYIALDESLKTQAMFPSAYFWWDKDVGASSFVIINNHGVGEGSIDENGGRKNKYLFRIMLDSEARPMPDKDEVLMAIATGATICSTNRPPRLTDTEYYC